MNKAKAYTFAALGSATSEDQLRRSDELDQEQQGNHRT